MNILALLSLSSMFIKQYGYCYFSYVHCVCRVWAFSFQRNTQMRPIEALQWMKGNEDYYKVKYGRK